MKRRRSSSAFSLVEMLTAIAIYSIILLVLVQLASQASRLWKRGTDQDDYRMRTRAMLSYMARELKMAALPLNPTNQASLELLITPNATDADNNPDSIFWQAPIATETTAGDLAEIGYFIRWTAGTARLCRFFVNPSDAQYAIYTSPDSWITSGLLSEMAPADAPNNYRGLFLENVIGFWVVPYSLQNEELPKPYDSRSASNKTHPLPAFIELSLAFVDPVTAARIKATGAQTSITGLYGAADAEQFLKALPAPIRAGTSIANLKVSLDNYR